MILKIFITVRHKSHKIMGFVILEGYVVGQ